MSLFPKKDEFEKFEELDLELSFHYLCNWLNGLQANSKNFNYYIENVKEYFKKVDCTLKDIIKGKDLIYQTKNFMEISTIINDNTKPSTKEDSKKIKSKVERIILDLDRLDMSRLNENRDYLEKINNFYNELIFFEKEF